VYRQDVEIWLLLEFETGLQTLLLIVVAFSVQFILAGLKQKVGEFIHQQRDRN
jgi:hypothetical protein